MSIGNPTIVSSERRKAIVQRIRPGESVVIAANIKDEDELAYALSFLAQHFIYKRSKAANTVSTKAVTQVAGVLSNMLDWHLSTFEIEIEDEVVEATAPVSGLGNDVIANPFSYR